MIPLTLGQIASAVGGVLYSAVDSNEFTVSGAVCTDSRELTAGGIFVAKPGEYQDGHDYIPQAQERGATAAIVERVNASVSLPQILVPNSIAALSQLAAHVLQEVRGRGNIRVVGITGSNGKTSTKNMLAKILSAHGNTVAPIASYNNEVGAPLTILRIDFDTRFLIVEMGAAGVGSIERLARIAPPDIGIELKVGLAHAGVFGGLEVTKQIKAELLPYVSQLTILNQDDPLVMQMETHTPVQTFGFDASSHYRIANPKLTIGGTSFELQHGGHNYPIQLRVLGEHQLYNATAAIAAAHGLGVDIQSAITVLEGMELAERWRMQLLQRSDGVRIINDAYNASPDSMRAALQTLATLGRQGHRTVAVLGAMAELGELAQESHDYIGRLVVRYNIDQLFVIGEDAKIIHMAATQEGSWDGESVFIAEPTDAVDLINSLLTAGDVVLVKSSNSAGLRFIGDQLAEE